MTRGHVRRRMGRGPEALLSAGLAARLWPRDTPIEIRAARAGPAFPAEPGAAFELNRQIASRDRRRQDDAARSRWCSRAIASALSGAIAGDGDRRFGCAVVRRPWRLQYAGVDVVRDFCDGMALSVACGGCWTAMSAGIPGFRPIEPWQVVLAGARDFDPGRARALRSCGRSRRDRLRDRGRRRPGRSPGAPRRRCPGCTCHLDLDVLDPSEGAANQYAVAGGLRCADVVRLLDRARSTFTIAGLTISAYDPAHDPAGTVAAAGVELALACAPVR